MKHHRAILAWLLAIALGVILAGAGCANGGSDSASSGDDGSADGAGDVVVDATMDGGCSGGKTKCGGTCTNTGNDPKNCGKCGLVCGMGEVCSMGVCGFTCSAGETICGLPPEGGTPDAGVTPDASVTGDASTADGGANSGDDAAVEAGEPESGTTGDGGPVQPYCANLNNDPANCGACGNSCGTNGSCTNGMCVLNCPTGQKACFATNTCIPNDTCCQSGECMVTGEVCPMPGGTCQCPAGEKECIQTADAGGNNSCISSSACCTNADCPVAGQSCPVPGQPCKCSASLQCCVGGDCPTEPHVSMYTCMTNTCGIGECATGCYDLDGRFSDGCECCDDTYGKTCTTPTSGGSLTLGAAALSYTGTIPTKTGEDWFTVTFNSESTTTFHGLISLTTNPSNEFVFDVVQSSCTGSTLTCGTEGGNSTAITTWEESYTGPNPPADPTQPTEFQAIPTIGTVFVKVYRASMSAPATCDQFVLEISE